MSYLDKYMIRDNMYGNSARDIRIQSTLNMYSSNFTDSPSYYQLVSDNPSTPLLDCHVLDGNDGTDQKILLTLHGSQIAIGNLVTWKDDKWLVFNIDEFSEIYSRSIIRRSNSQLKWLDSSGNLKTVDYVLDAKTNFGVQDGRYLTIGDERRDIVIPNNPETRQLKRGIRFIIEGRAWIIAAINSLVANGLIHMTLDESDTNDAVDNLDLGIADYFGNVADYKIDISNGAAFSIHAGSTLQLNVKVSNRGEPITSPLLYSSSNPSVATVNSSGLVTTVANGSCIITVKLSDDPSIQATINGTVQFAVVDNYTVELLEGNTLTKNTQKTFTAVVKNNGIVDPSKFVFWYIFDDDKISQPVAATIVSNTTTQVTLKGNSSGYVQLKVNIIGLTGSFWIRVQVKGLI